MQSRTFSWQDATLNALRSFESPPNFTQQPQFPITLPQSAYDPTFSTAPSFNFAFDDPRLPTTVQQTPYGPGRNPTGRFENNESRQGHPDFWPGFDLDQTFSSELHAKASAYPDPSACPSQDASLQYICMPTRKTLPIVPIYDNTSTAPTTTASATSLSSSMLQVDLLQASNPNLYPQNSMPLTIKHPEFTQQRQQVSSPDAWATRLMSNVERLEQATSNPTGSMSYQQSPLTVNQQSQPHTQSHAKPQPQPYSTEQTPQYTFEQLHAILSQPHDMSVPSDVAELYQRTATQHDDIAATRLNSGNKETATLPSAIPSVPSLYIRTPGPLQRLAQSHPYTSPRFAPHGLPRLGVGGGPTAGSYRSVRPVQRTKRELSSVMPATAYLANLRRIVPAQVASERAPDEPYPRTQPGQGSIGLPYPFSLAPGNASVNGGGGGGGAGGNGLMPGSGSNSTVSLPSPVNHAMLPNLAMAEPRSASPKKEPGTMPFSPYGNGPNDGGSLRFYHGNAGQERPETATTVAFSSTVVSQCQDAERFSPSTTTSTTMMAVSPPNDRLQPQTRATAARKRADDEILQHSFRGEGDWRRRMVLEAVLSSTFVADNTLEPSITSTGTGVGVGGLVGGVGGDGLEGQTMVGLEDISLGLGSPGKSVYAVFLEQVEKSEWRCLFGDRDHPCPSQAVAFRRLERALDHVRSHLNHRPFVCKGECQKGESCDARFFARSHLQDHVKRTESACCETCGQVIRIQNMPRHRLAH